MIGKTQGSLTEVTGCPVEGTEWDEASCSYRGDSRVYSQPSSCAIPRSHLRLWCVSRASLRPSVFELRLLRLLLSGFWCSDPPPSFYCLSLSPPRCLNMALQHSSILFQSAIPSQLSHLQGLVSTRVDQWGSVTTHLLPASNHQWAVPCSGV